MQTFLDSIGLGNLKPIFVDSGLDGKFFLECSKEELGEGGITKLQWKKIMSRMPRMPQ